MKKLLLYLFVVVLSLTMTFAFVSCGGETPDDPNTPDDPTGAHTHTASDWIIDTNATCAAQGAKHKECTECKEVLESGTIDKIGHTPSDWIVDTDATCKAEGAKHKECTVCKEVLESEQLPTADHNYVDDYCSTCEKWYYSEGIEYSVKSVYGYEWCEVRGIGTCTDEVIKIAPAYEGKAVTNIKEYAFSGCDTITEVSIPASITYINVGAFKNCENLVSVTFDGDTTLTDIPVETFSGCTSLTEIAIPASVQTIGASAFNACKNLVNVSFAENSSLYEIGKEAFSGCSSLTEIALPKGVKSISEKTFSDCGSLEEITLPTNVTSIDKYAFYGCDRLTNIKIDEASESYKSIDGNLYSKDGKTLVKYAPGKTDIRFTVPEEVTDIATYAFYNCKNIVTIDLSSNLTSIGSSAFSGCDRLIEVYNPSSLSIRAGSWDYGYVANYAKNVYSDANGSKLEVTDDGFVLYSGEDLGYCYLVAYTGDKSDVTIPVPEKPDGTFYHIKEYAFYGNKTVKNIVVPEGVDFIKTNAFRGCPSLESITVADTSQNYTSIDGNLYNKDGTTLLSYAAGKADTRFTVPEGVTTIDSYAFAGSTNLKAVAISDSVTNIEAYAFEYCESLERIFLPSSVQYVGYCAFYGCDSVTAYLEHENVPYQFDSGWNSGSVQHVTGWTYGLHIPSEEWIVDTEPTCTLEGSKHIECIECGEALETGTIEATGIHTPAENWTVDKEPTCAATGEKHLECASCGETLETGIIEKSNTHVFNDTGCKNCDLLFSVGLEYTLNADEQSYTVTGLGTYDSAFVVVANKYKGLPVIAVGEGAFKDTNIISIYLPDSITIIGREAFRDCDGLVGVSIPNGVTSIEAYTFEGCGYLIEVDIPVSVTDVNLSAFYSCPKLESIELHAGVTNITGASSNHLGYVESSPAVIAEENEIYKSIDGSIYSKDGKTLLFVYASGESFSILEGVESIGDYAFRGISTLKSVEISATVKAIGERAFYLCQNLKSVTFAEESAFKTVGNAAFESCTSLERVILPDGTESIATGAFMFCTNLKFVVIPASVTVVEKNAFSDPIGLTAYPTTVLCEADSKPSGWQTGWQGPTGTTVKVVWNYKEQGIDPYA